MELTPRPFISKFSLEIPNNIIVRAAFLSCGQVEANRRTTKACCMPFDRDACAVSPPVSLQITIVFPSRYCPEACVGANGRAPSCGRCARPVLSLSSSFHEIVVLLFSFLEIKGIREKKFLQYVWIYLSKRGKEGAIYLSRRRWRISLERGGVEVILVSRTLRSPLLEGRRWRFDRPTRMWQSSKALRGTTTVILFA